MSKFRRAEAVVIQQTTWIVRFDSPYIGQSQRISKAWAKHSPRLRKTEQWPLAGDPRNLSQLITENRCILVAKS